MRFSKGTRFPHPVLSHLTGDFVGDGEFTLRFQVEEDLENGALTIRHQITLTENEIQKLVISGKASVGCFVKCRDTYYSELKTFTWPEGRCDFAAGTLLNRVTLQPLIWMKTDLLGWDPGTIHPEFSPPISLKNGDIIAIGEEHIISVGQAKLAPIESIFELDHSSSVPEGKLQVELERDRITILTGKQTHENILLLRGQYQGRPVVMNSIYLPAVMEVLDALSDGAEQYESLRWYSPFMARCDAVGIDLSAGASILEHAQLLLDSPSKSLAQLVMGDE